MKHTTAIELLTNPTLPLDEGFRHMSYAIFRTDEDFGRVIAARFPAESLLSVGDVLQSSLRLSDEAMAYLLRTGDQEPPLFCLTDVGLGLLCKRYDAAVGLGLYLHIHCRPEAGARLLCAGALGLPGGSAFDVTGRIKEFSQKPTTDDARSFPPLLEAWRAVQRDRGALSDSRAMREDDISLVTLDGMESALLHMADFAGCRISCTLSDGDRDREVAVYRPTVLDGLLLYILTEVRAHAVSHEATVEILAVEDPRGRWGDRLCLAFTYQIDTLHMTGEARTRLAESRRYVSEMADESGLDLHFPPLLPPELRTPDRKRGDGVVPQTVSVEWLRDPTLLPSSDLKTTPELQQ